MSTMTDYPNATSVYDLNGLSSSEMLLRPVEDLLSTHRTWKRLIDILGAVIAILISFPIVALAAIAVRLSSGSPIIFKQQRAGYKGKVFTLYKLRSMHNGPNNAAHEEHLRELLCGGVQPAKDHKNNPRDNFKVVDDPRITPVGRILRKTSIDELPQLINVLKGDMSLVGPRPDPIYALSSYKPWHLNRLMAMPGITGLWQVSGRSRLSHPDMIRLDISYVRHRSLWLDLKILVKTVWIVISAKGAA